MVLTRSLQSSAMIICSHAVTSSSLTVDGALHASPVQQRGMFPVMHVERSVNTAQLPAFWQNTVSTDSHWSPRDLVVVVVVGPPPLVPPSAPAGPIVHDASLSSSATHTIAGADLTSGLGPCA
jgi:hypothetical protein